jgi:1-phosphofructokinase family hexose kinase
MIVTVTLNPAIDKVYWVDHLKIGEVTQEEFLTRATRSSTSAGGKGVNISVLLARLGVDNVAMGFVGGHTGHVVVRDLRDENVTTNFVWAHGETRTNVTILEKGREHIPIDVTESGFRVTRAEMERFMRRYRRIVRRATWVVLGGSVPPGIDDDVYRELTEIAKDTGAKVVVTAGGEPLTRALKACPTIVKPDVREHVSFDGASLATLDEIIAVGKTMVECGVEMIILSHDVTGDIVVTPDAIWEIQASIPKTQFRNLVGADDALVGGILYQMLADAPIPEVLRFGMAAGILSAESDEKICQEIDHIRNEMECITVREL